MFGFLFVFIRKNKHNVQDKNIFFTQSGIFNIVSFCVHCVRLLQHLDCNLGRQIAVLVCNYKLESGHKTRKKQLERRSISSLFSQ